MKTRTIVEYLLAVIIVLILGGLAGWYFFLRTQTNTLNSQSVARGFGVSVPFGNADGGALNTPSPSSGTDWAQQNSPTNTGGGKRPPQLWQVASGPVAGKMFLGSGDEVRLRYVERASGYVFEANPETGKVTRLTNTLMPKIYEAYLTENGHVFERSLDAVGNITTFVGTISTTTETSDPSSRALTGFNLTKNIVSMSVHPVSGALFYILRGSDGAIGVNAEWDGQKQKNIFGSVIMSWRPTTLEDGRIILVQAAADGVPGFAYEVKKDGTMSPLLGPIPGLTLRVRSVPGGSALLWGLSDRGALSLFVQVSQNATPVRVPVRTTADKCAWAPDLHRESTSDSKAQSSLEVSGKDLVAYCGVPQGQPGQNFLDEWYRGAAHSSDALWRIDASAGTAEAVFTPPSDTSIDIENIAVDGGRNYITFTNAADKSLWLLRLEK